MVDHSRQLQGVLCALALGIGVNALCPVTNAKVKCEELNIKDECKEYLNPTHKTSSKP